MNKVTGITLTINNQNYNVRANASILQACEENGIHIPRFCYHEKLSVAGNCRICLVEVEKSPKPVVSCAMPVSKGMIIHTDTPLVRKVREGVLEFLLINHPLDCPICDQGGECDLQDETLQYASDRGRYYDFKRRVEDKEVGPIIKTIMTRCIHCTRCVRFSTEVSGQEIMGAFGRGEETEIGTYIQEFIKTELSGNLADICPVGALTSKPYAYKARSWELQSVDTIDFFDAMCTDIVVQTKKSTRTGFYKEKVINTTKEEIVRILPKNNSLYETNWISDKTRYAFSSLYNQRIKQIINKNINSRLKTLSNHDILFEILNRCYANSYSYLKAKEEENIIEVRDSIKLGAIIDSLIDIEGLYFLSEALKFYGTANIQKGNLVSKINYDIPNFYTINKDLSNLLDLNTLLLIGTNTRFEASILNTNLRKQQITRDLTYFNIGATNNLKFKNKHCGININALISILKNKLHISRVLANTKNSTIFIGEENLKGKNGKILQNLVRVLSKKLFLKTKNSERLGILHSTPTSLIFNFLGVNSHVRSSFYVEEIENKNINLLFTVQAYNINNQKWINPNTDLFSFSTHQAIEKNIKLQKNNDNMLIESKLETLYQHLKEGLETNNFNENILTQEGLSLQKAKYIIPLKTFYEKDGYLITTEGRLRKYYKTVTAPNKLITLDSFFVTLLRAEKSPNKWLETLNTLSNFKLETCIKKNLEKVINFTNFFSFSFIEPGIFVKEALFTKNIKNFYTSDLLSANSPTMGESALFINNNRNYW